MSGSALTVSRVTQSELIEESESITMIKQAWAIEHDTDTDTELIAWAREENERRERKRKVCGDDDPAVADQVDDDPAVADQVDDLQALPSSQRKIITRPRPKVKLTAAEGATQKL